MLIISQNAINYEIEIPKYSVLRINLAWCNSISELENILKTHQENKIFIDLPIGRIKPPNNRYTLEEIIPLFENYKNKVIKPSEEEINLNNRSRSAKLRFVTRSQNDFFYPNEFKKKFVNYFELEGGGI